MVIKRRKNKYISPKEKLQILKEIDNGKITAIGAAKKHGVSRSQIYYWRASLLEEQYGEFQKEVVSRESLTLLREKNLEKDIEKLKIKLAEAFLEIDFLKKARSYMVRGKKLNSSVITGQNLDQFQEDVK